VLDFAVMTPEHPTDKAGALAWLAGRLHFEQLLADLHAEVERTGEPVTVAPPRQVTVAERPAKAA
jgi:hypothetical protein